MTPFGVEQSPASLGPVVVPTAEVLVEVAGHDEARLGEALSERRPLLTLDRHDPSEFVPALCRVVLDWAHVTVPRQHGPIDDDLAEVARVKPRSDTPSRVGGRKPFDEWERGPDRRPPASGRCVTLLGVDRSVGG